MIIAIAHIYEDNPSFVDVIDTSLLEPTLAKRIEDAARSKDQQIELPYRVMQKDLMKAAVNLPAMVEARLDVFSDD